MPKKIEEKIHILSPYRGYLAPANVMGPIVHPLSVDKSVVAKILMSGADVYEYLPHNKKTLKLTLSNLNDSNRYNEVNHKPTKADNTPVAPVMKIGVPAMTEVEDIKPEIKEETSTNLNPVIEEPIATETTQPASKFIFEYNEDGTVNENKIEWSKYSKNQRKEIRAQIIQYNASLTK